MDASRDDVFGERARLACAGNRDIKSGKFLFEVVLERSLGLDDQVGLLGRGLRVNRFALFILLALLGRATGEEARFGVDEQVHVDSALEQGRADPGDAIDLASTLAWLLVLAL